MYLYFWYHKKSHQNFVRFDICNTEVSFEFLPFLVDWDKWDKMATQRTCDEINNIVMI